VDDVSIKHHSGIEFCDSPEFLLARCKHNSEPFNKDSIHKSVLPGTRSFSDEICRNAYNIDEHGSKKDANVHNVDTDALRATLRKQGAYLL